MKHPTRTYWDDIEKHSYRNRDHFSQAPRDQNFGRDRGYEGIHIGKGPKGYRRSDESIKEEVCEMLTEHPEIDPTEIEVDVKQGVVILRGTVSAREMKRMAEDVALDCRGVQDVQNELYIGTNYQNDGMLAARWQSDRREVNKTKQKR